MGDRDSFGKAGGRRVMDQKENEKKGKKPKVQLVNIPKWIGKFPFPPEEKRFVVIHRGDELSGVYGFEGHQVALRRFVSLDQFTVSQWTLSPGNHYEPAG